ncbi:hypothetical protein [uncultured Sphingomonas sp.]|uniref:hypothetical protein n=1 Tax=uncultured Sphingomonas sp. TaxID=158754 RepID=UPI0025EBBE12|nr:hypothetical protein [uncultured Sphingomonas sp.]
MAVDGALKALSRFLNPASPVRRALVFIYVARNEPATLEQISKRLRIPSGTAYDDLRALGKVDPGGKEGSRLLLEMPGGPQDPAYRYTLSPRGKMLVDCINFEVAAGLLEAEEDEPLDDYFEATRHTRG